MPETTNVGVRQISSWNSGYCVFCKKKAEKEAFCSNSNATVAIGFCHTGTSCEEKAKNKAKQEIKNS